MDPERKELGDQLKLMCFCSNSDAGRAKRRCGVLLLHSLPSSHFHGKSRKVILQITLQMLYLANTDIIEKLSNMTKYFPQMNAFSSELHLPMLSLVGYFKMYKGKRSFTQTRSLAVTEPPDLAKGN